MREVADFFARVSDDPLTMAFEEEKKTMPPMAGMRREPPPWNGGTFAEFAPQAFMAGPERPLALYVHVPFCHHHCTFCPFYINQTKKDFSSKYTALLLKEIAGTAEVLKDVAHKRKVDVIYFGGGTPTDLEKDDMASVIRSLFDHFDISPDAEVTVEGRNTGFTAEKGKAWVEAGANRVSIGLQAANTQLRRKLGRLASREEAAATLNELADTGASVVIDLLYGLPGQTEEILIDDVRYISEQTRIAGLDLYELRMFPGSPLDKAIERGKMPPMPEFPEKARLFGTAYKGLIAGGFDHFSPRHWRRTPNERSLYNRLAGGQTDMIPFGSAAGGRLGTIGLGTARDIKSYTEMVERGEKPLGRITQAPLAADKTGFDRELDLAFEAIRVPAIDKWPEPLRESGRLLLAQWKKAGLLEGNVDGSGMAFTCAGFYWSSRMKKLLLEFAAEPVPA